MTQLIYIFVFNYLLILCHIFDERVGDFLFFILFFFISFSFFLWKLCWDEGIVGFVQILILFGAIET